LLPYLLNLFPQLVIILEAFLNRALNLRVRPPVGRPSRLKEVVAAGISVGKATKARRCRLLTVLRSTADLLWGWLRGAGCQVME
jgi:hypothetical protein